MPTKRNIAVVTGSRAEFGLLEPVMRAVDEHDGLRLQVVVAGLHFVTGTWRDVRDAGFVIAGRARMQKRDRTGRAADVEALGRGVAGFGRTFAALKPDVVVVLGDRIEPFAAASAASVGGVRLAHIHGGDRAEGVADEAMRHAIGKLAHLHFPATAQSRRRLVRMGEDPAHVWNVGSPSVDGLRGLKPADDAPEVIVLQHPIGAADKEEQRWMTRTLAAVGRRRRLVLAPNADAGSAGIRAALEGEHVVEHLPRRRFAGLLAGAKAIVGNSSAGLIEAAVLRTPCVNIGPRQAGREKPANVVDCDYGERDVRRALREAEALDLSRMRHPYGRGDAGWRIADHLARFACGGVPLRKRNRY